MENTLDIYVKFENQEEFLNLYSVNIDGRYTPSEIFSMYINTGNNIPEYLKGVYREEGRILECVLKRPDGGVWEEIVSDNIKFERV